MPLATGSLTVSVSAIGLGLHLPALRRDRLSRRREHGPLLTRPPNAITGEVTWGGGKGGWLELRVPRFYRRVSSTLQGDTCFVSRSLHAQDTGLWGEGCWVLAVRKGLAHYGCWEAPGSVGHDRGQGQVHREWDTPLPMASLPCHSFVECQTLAR